LLIHQTVFVFRENESWRKTKEERIVPEFASNSANTALKTKPTKQGIPEEITCQMRNIRISDGGNKTVKPVEEKVDNLYTYWKKRFSLFSRFQDGIMLDRGIYYEGFVLFSRYNRLFFLFFFCRTLTNTVSGRPLNFPIARVLSNSFELK